MIEPDESQVGRAPAEDEAPAVVAATGVTLHGKRGVVYGPVTFTVPRGRLVVLQGPQGAGRSSLLLTLAGRMKPDRDGVLSVLGYELPRERNGVQRAAAIAGFEGIDELDDSVTVLASMRERLAWLSPWYRRTPQVTSASYRALAGAVFGDRPLPPLSTVIWDLDEVDEMLLRIVIALLQEPDLLVIDDLDQVHDQARRQLVWERLEALTTGGLTVIASVASENEVDVMSWERTPQVVQLTTGPQAVKHSLHHALHTSAV